jgi:hypothetical protein
MTQIRQFVVETASDIRGGRQTWRVLSALWSVAFAIAVTAPVIPR